MLNFVDEGDKVVSHSGIKFKVLHKGRHAQDCSIPMVVYTNLEPTVDSETGTIWVMEESLFLKRFYEGEDEHKNEETPHQTDQEE